MPRLFLAIDLSPETLADLRRIQPDPQRGVRPVAAAQLHLTLHFLGEAEIATVVRALENVAGEAFSLRIHGAGRFPGRDRSSILWAGVHPDPGLMSLHQRLRTALTAAGFEVDQRRYSPHITLARCTHQANREFLESYSARHEGFTTRPSTVAGFHLYSSTLTSAGPRYRREHTWPLDDCA